MKQTIKFSSRNSEKVGENYRRLLELHLAGRGNETLMICYPNAPFHYEKKQSLWELDGIPQVHYYQEKVYDYPVKTIDEWIELYNKQGYFAR